MSGRSLSGGDALTWALILGVGGWAALKVVQEVKERKPTTSTPTTGTGGSSTPAPAAPAGPVVTTPGGTIVQPTAPVIVGGAQPTAPTLPGGMVAAVLPLKVLSSSPTSVTVQAVMAARLRWSGISHFTGAEGFTLAAGEVRGYTLAPGAVLECMNNLGVWVAVASSSSPNTVPPVVVGSPLTPVLPVAPLTPWPSLPGLPKWIGTAHPITMPVERPLPFGELVTL